MTGFMLSELDHLRRFFRDDRGATAAEFAMVVGLFLVLVFGTINFSLAMSSLIQIHYAAERTARCISVDTTGVCNTPTAVNSYAKRYYQGLGLTSLTFTTPPNSCGNYVVGSGTYPVFIGISELNVTLSASACYPLI